MKTPSIDDLVLLAEAAGWHRAALTGSSDPHDSGWHNKLGNRSDWQPHIDRNQLAEVSAALTLEQSIDYAEAVRLWADQKSRSDREPFKLFIFLTAPPEIRFACLVEVLR